jgi:hypothetical protein
MEDPDPLSRFCCQNERCVAYGSYGAGNLSVCDHIGKRRDIRLLYCKVCKKRFSERKGTVFYRAHADLPRSSRSSGTCRRGAACGRRGGWWG